MTRQDIGGELISIITKGMYADPKDALREYVQNGIDAEAKNINIKVRHNSIVIVDDGKGMDKGVLRRAVRVGISDKNPSKSVGFMGIGLYSSFHLCDELVIYSKTKDEVPNKLVFRFKDMRDYLDSQKDTRIIGKSKIQQQIDLQTLLETNIDYITLPLADFPNKGTRVELHGIESNFFNSLSKFEEVSEYLESVVPLPFSAEFTPGEKIQHHIDEVCKKHKTVFKLINLYLDINSGDIQLFRPYKDSDFLSKTNTGKPLEPKFYEMKNGDEFLGIAWACLNNERDTIANSKVRGFIIKKQGFTIGKRSDLIPLFGRQTYSNRAVGEFLVLNSKLLPNAPRSDFEYSGLRTALYAQIQSVASKFSEFANDYQEKQKAANDLANAIDEYNEINAQLQFFESNSDKLLEFFGKVSNTDTALQKKIAAKKFTNLKEAQDFVKKLNTLKNSIKSLIDNKKKKTVKKSTTAVAKKMVDNKPDRKQEPAPESLDDLIFTLGFDLTDDLVEIIKLIDEKFIKSPSNNKEEYQERLIQLQNEIEEIFEEE